MSEIYICLLQKLRDEAPTSVPYAPVGGAQGSPKMAGACDHDAPGEIEITSEMIKAGSDAVYSSGAECLSRYFSASGLAIEVYRAMAAVDLSRRCSLRARNRRAR